MKADFGAIKTPFVAVDKCEGVMSIRIGAGEGYVSDGDALTGEYFCVSLIMLERLP